jgi:hypothetical protein
MKLYSFSKILRVEDPLVPALSKSLIERAKKQQSYKRLFEWFLDYWEL